MADKYILEHVRGLFCLGTVFLFLSLAGCQGDEIMLPTTPGPDWWSIVPGVSTEAEVIKVLAEPRRREKDGVYSIYTYPSPEGGMAAPVWIVFQGGRVRLIRDAGVTERYLTRILEQYGEPEKVTWSPAIHMHTRLFVFSLHGMAVVAQNQVPPSRSFIVEKWYFEPMTLSQFEETLLPLVSLRAPDPKHDPFQEDYWVQEP